MKKANILLLVCCLCFLGNTRANNVQITGVSTTVTANGTSVNFSIKWDNSWRGGPANNWDAVWVFIKYKGSQGWYEHLDMTGDNIVAPSGLTVTVPTDKKGCFIYRTDNGFGNVATATVSLGIVPKPGSFDVKVFGLEMVYIPQGSFYLGHSGGNSDNFGEANTGGTTPFNITSSFPPTIGTATGNLYDSRVAGSAAFNSSWPTGFNAFYMMKYELSQAGYRDFLNACPGFTYSSFSERSDLTSANYNVVGTRLFPAGYRNSLVVGAAASNAIDPIKANANANTTYNEATDGEWVAANFLYWSDAAAFLDWAALRPMTEFEYEKACNGPNALGYPQFASGTYIQVPNISAAGILNAFTSGETITHANLNNNYINTNEFWGALTNGNNIGQPLRSGFAADALSTRTSSGGSYYGIMELTGNLWEPVVTAANVAGRSFNGNLGDGSISGLNARANEATWPGTQNVITTANAAGEVLKLNTAGISKKGGSFVENLYYAVSDVNYDPAVTIEAYPTVRTNMRGFGCRGVRQQ